jgi:hypothetical protein
MDGAKRYATLLLHALPLSRTLEEALTAVEVALAQPAEPETVPESVLETPTPPDVSSSPSDTPSPPKKASPKSKRTKKTRSWKVRRRRQHLSARLSVTGSVDLSATKRPWVWGGAEMSEEQLGDVRQRAEMIAEILYGLYGERALEVLGQQGLGAAMGVALAAKWDKLQHPRGPDGRFIKKGTGQAGEAAVKAVGEVISGKGTHHTPESVAGHLALLSVKQLRDLHREHGQKIPGKLREQLVQGVLARLQAGGGGVTPPSPVQPPAPSALTSEAADKAVSDALNSLGGNESTVLLRDMRRVMPEGMFTKESFDEAILRMANEGKVLLHRHDQPSLLTPEEREEIVHDPKSGMHFVSVMRAPGQQPPGPPEPAPAAKTHPLFDETKAPYVTVFGDVLGPLRTKQDVDLAARAIHDAQFTSNPEEVRREIFEHYGLDLQDPDYGGTYDTRRFMHQKVEDALNPDGPIQNRISQAKAAHEKVRALAALESLGESRTRRLEDIFREDLRLSQDLSLLHMDLPGLEKRFNKAKTDRGKKAYLEAKAKIDELRARRGALSQERDALYEKGDVRQATKKALAVPDPSPVQVAPLPPEVGEYTTKALTPAVDFLSGIVGKGAHGTDLPQFGIEGHAGSYRAKYFGNNQIAVGEITPATTWVHEMAHGIEDEMPGAKEAARAFLKYRVGNEPMRKLKELNPGGSYEDDEVGWKDEFDKAFGSGGVYVGRYYDFGATEVISMGVEKLYGDAADFAAKDPEYCAFIVGILDGSLRTKVLPRR